MSKPMGHPVAGSRVLAIGYTRVSGRVQVSGHGLGIQEAKLRAWEAAAPHHTLLKVFSDQGVSGAATRRPALDALKEYARSTSAERIVVSSVDRLGRTVGPTLDWARRMQQHGVHIIALDEGIDTEDPQGWALFRHSVAAAEADWRRIRERTSSGRDQKAREGGWPAGPPPYGYKIDKRGPKESFLAIDEDEARVILKAVELVVDHGLTYQAAADELNRLGLLTRSGRPWTLLNLHHRLTSDTLDGYATYRKPGTGAKATRVDADGVPVLGPTITIKVPALLTPERVAALRRTQRRRTDRPRKPNQQYPLSGRILSACGRRYTGGGRPTGRLYRCQGTTGSNPCACTYLEADAVESAVWEKLSTALSATTLQALACHDSRITQRDRAQHEAREQHLLDAIHHHEQLVEKSLPRYVTSGLDPVIAEAALGGLRGEIDAWRHELSEVRRQLTERPPTGKTEEIFSALRTWIVPEVHDFKKRPGSSCRVRAWHEETGTPVPADVDEAQWPTVLRILRSRHGSRHFKQTRLDLRAALNAMLHRLRRGLIWSELGAWGDPEAIRHRQGTWFREGTWQALMAHLTSDGSGEAVFSFRRIPALHVICEPLAGLPVLLRDPPLEISPPTALLQGGTPADAAAFYAWVLRAARGAETSQSGLPPAM
ncbi:recombinase family protein [Streptomyces mesophilus]|uniref:recombinase family protein n=1 Tax=Streptomyces mesophilus TaxID=1775132 RepID=UPI0033198F87